MHSCTDAKTPVPCGNFLANYSLVKLPGCARGISITRSDKYYADVWLVSACKNDNYVRNQTCPKYSAQLLVPVSTPCSHGLVAHPRAILHLRRTRSIDDESRSSIACQKFRETNPSSNCSISERWMRLKTFDDIRKHRNILPRNN